MHSEYYGMMEILTYIALPRSCIVAEINLTFVKLSAYKSYVLNVILWLIVIERTLSLLCKTPAKCSPNAVHRFLLLLPIYQYASLCLIVDLYPC